VVSILALFALLSLLLAFWQWLAAWQFPLHKRVEDKSFTPAVTLLKPLKGCDAKTLECLRSWFMQDYPGAIQALFGVASEEDSACESVRQLIKEHPHRNVQLVICKEVLGVNAKVSTLIQLLRQTQNEVVVISDADVRVSADFLANAVAPLRDPEVGLVNSFYRLANPHTLAMHWEAVAINADFWSQVLQGKSLQPLDFALGAAMITRREQLSAIGGFEALADYLADDFQLGNRIARTGKSIALCPVVVDCLAAPMNWEEVWTHQLRWARTIRVSKPLPYAFSILSNATLWPFLWFLAQPGGKVLAFLIGCLLVRMVMTQTLQKRLGPETPNRHWWLAPIKDLLQFALWGSAFFGRSIVWRGQRLYLQRNGKLSKIPSPSVATITHNNSFVI
jgi:ceramide glucosyltransferase